MSLYCLIPGTSYIPEIYASIISHMPTSFILLFLQFVQGDIVLVSNPYPVYYKSLGFSQMVHYGRSSFYSTPNRGGCPLEITYLFLFCLWSDMHCISISSVKIVLFMLSGFVEALASERKEFTLVALKEGVSSAIGATALGAKEAGLSLPIDYAANTIELFHYKPE